MVFSLINIISSHNLIKCQTACVQVVRIPSVTFVVSVLAVLQTCSALNFGRADNDINERKFQFVENILNITERKGNILLHMFGIKVNLIIPDPVLI